LKTYLESGIPAEIDPDAHRSVVEMLGQAMKRMLSGRRSVLSGRP